MQFRNWIKHLPIDLYWIGVGILSIPITIFLFAIPFLFIVLVVMPILDAIFVR